MEYRSFSLIFCLLFIAVCNGNLLCHHGWNALGNANFIVNSNDCSITANAAGNGVIWLGDATGTNPSDRWDDFIIDIKYTSSDTNPGGLLFRAQDVAQCAQTNGNCVAYWIYLYAEFIGLKGPGGDANGWIVDTQHLGYRLAANQPHTVRVIVHREHLEVLIDGESKLQYDGLTELSEAGGIGYRVPGPMTLTISSITFPVRVESTRNNIHLLVRDENVKYDRTAANEFCQKQFDTELATVRADELDAIYAAKVDMIQNVCPWIWIGLTDPDQTGWRWEDGTPYTGGDLTFYQNNDASTATKTGAILETCGEGLSPREPSAFEADMFLCNRDGPPNLSCQSGWNQFGAANFQLDNTLCTISSNNANNGVIWLGNAAGDQPDPVYRNFGAEITYKSSDTNPGGFIFRAKNVVNCGNVNGNCEAYWLYLYADNIGLKGPNGWVIDTKPNGFGYRLDPDRDHRVRIEVKDEDIEAWIDDDMQLQCNGCLTELGDGGGIGYRVPGPMTLTIYEISVWEHGDDGEPLCQPDIWTELTGSFQFNGDKNTPDSCTMESTGGGNGLIEVNEEIDLCDIYVEFTTTISSAQHAGVFLRNVFPGTAGSANLIGYYFGVNPNTNQYMLGQYDVDNGAFIGNTGNVVGGDVAVNQEIKMSITLMQDTIKGAINDIIQSVYTDSKYQCGGAGFMTFGGNALFGKLVGGDPNGPSMYGLITTCGHLDVSQPVMCLNADTDNYVRQYTCNAQDTQYWAYDSKTRQIHSKTGNGCIDTEATGNGGKLKIVACDESKTTQQWAFTDEPGGNTLPDAMYNFGGSRCTDIHGSDFTNRKEGGIAQIWDCHGGNHQQLCYGGGKTSASPPVDCEVGNWYDTSTCSKACNGGVKTQQRNIIKSEENGGSRGECDNLQQQIACNEQPCPDGCTLNGSPGYSFEGVPATVSGDPHFRMFNGKGHDFQGVLNQNEFYYMHPCKRDSDGNRIKRDDMPFALLGKHWRPDPNRLTVSTLDYITFELYDDDKSIYYVWLSSSLHSYANKVDATTDSLYDDANPGTLLPDGIEKSIGNRFKIIYVQRSPDTEIAVDLIINGECTVKLYMRSQGWSHDGRDRMHWLEVEPPQCYKCYTCGLFGDFRRNDYKLRTCGHRNAPFSRAYTTSYEKTGITWERTHVKTAERCKDNWDTRRRRRRLIDDEDGGEYTPEMPEGVAVENMCATANEQPAKDACQQARDAETACCANMPDYCDQQQKDCNFDVCVSIDVEGTTATFEATKIFKEALDLKCSLPDNADSENPANTVPDPNAKIDCILSDWQYTQCSEPCGGGTLKRTRTIQEAAQNGGYCPTLLEQELPCNEQDCCANIDIATFNWDDLSETGNGIPDFNYDMNVEDSDLSLNIRVALKYLGRTSADYKEALWGTTYILDFESFDAHKDAIYSPGSCQNRRKEDFYGSDGVTLKNFEEWWKYSETPMESGHIGAPGNYLAYPPTNTDKWKISMGNGIDKNLCGHVVYEGHFTWQELRDCDDGSGGGTSYTKVTQDENWLNLTGNFYINIVSPFDYDEDFDYYRIYQILSQPFVIAVSKTVYVLGSAGINVLTMSIIAVYKEDDENTFRLIVLTESSDYLKLSRSSTDLAGFTGNAGLQQGDFIAVTTSVTDAERLANTPSGCLSNKDFLCSQLWEIRAENVNCNTNPNGIDFSGKYALKFDTECRSPPDVDADSATHCDTWLPAHTQIANGVTLEANLVWKDEICDPLLFKQQFTASMQFYIDPGFGTKAGSDHLYQVGESQIYIEITTTFPTATFDVFDTKLMNVWICTFDPTYYDSVSDPDPNEFKGGCYDEKRDGGLVEDGNKYFYHIYAGTDGSEKEEFKLIGHPGSTDDDKNKLLFYFTVPHQIARDRLYIHAQIEVSLTELNGGRRRRLLLNAGTSITNQIDHFVDFVGIGDGTEPKKEPIGDNNNYEPQQPFNYNPPQQPPMNPVINTPTTTTSSPWILVIGGFLAMILIFNIGLLCYINCFKTKRQRNRISFNSRRRSGYSSVKHGDDSEYDDSENNPIINVNA